LNACPLLSSSVSTPRTQFIKMTSSLETTKSRSSFKDNNRVEVVQAIPGGEGLTLEELTGHKRELRVTMGVWVSASLLSTSVQSETDRFFFLQALLGSQPPSFTFTLPLLTLVRSLGTGLSYANMAPTTAINGSISTALNSGGPVRFAFSSDLPHLLG